MYIIRFNDSNRNVETFKGHIYNVSFFGEGIDKP